MNGSNFRMVAISSGANASTRATLAIAEPSKQYCKNASPEESTPTRTGDQLPLENMCVPRIPSDPDGLVKPHCMSLSLLQALLRLPRATGALTIAA